MATSLTVGATTFTTRQVIDHAFRRCKLVPQQVTSEHIQTALELLWLILGTWNTRGLALWAVDRPLISLQEATSDVALPVGTLDVLNANLRTLSDVPGTSSRHGTTAGNYYQFDLTSAAQVTHVGLTFTNDTTAGVTLQYTTDGSTYTSALVVPSKDYVAGITSWIEIPSAGVNTTAVRVVADATSTLLLSDLVLANNASDIPLAQVDRDAYSNFPNKQFLGRPTQYWYDRQRAQSKLVLWPAPSSAYTSLTILSLYTHRQLQDVGTLQQELELPQRWFMAAIAELARNLAFEVKEVDVALQIPLAAEADRQLSAAWDGETDRAPVRLLPSLRTYTRTR